jgi:hypothetical protein
MGGKACPNKMGVPKRISGDRDLRRPAKPWEKLKLAPQFEAGENSNFVANRSGAVRVHRPTFKPKIAMNTTPEPKESREKLETELALRATKSRRHARKNDLYGVACYALAILGSFFATLLAAFSDLPKAVVAAATAIPGTALLINSVFSFEKKAQWHRRRKMKYDALTMRLLYEAADPAAVSREWREFDEAVSRDYPHFGVFLSTDSKEER